MISYKFENTAVRGRGKKGNKAVQISGNPHEIIGLSRRDFMRNSSFHTESER
jgi:hypothetical protein